MIHALISSNEVVEDQAKVVAQVLILLIDDNLMVAWELDLIVIYQLREITD